VVDIAQEFYPQDGGESQLASKLRLCYVFYVTADDTSLVISGDLLPHNQSQRSCFAVIGEFN